MCFINLRNPFLSPHVEQAGPIAFASLRCSFLGPCLGFASRFSLYCVLAQLPKAGFFGEGRSGGSVIWGHKGIVARQIPFCAILIRRHAESPQMPPQRFEFLPVIQTNHEVGRDGLSNRHCWHKSLCFGNSFRAKVRECRMNRLDQSGQTAWDNRVMRHVSRHDVSRQGDIIWRSGVRICHFAFFELSDCDSIIIIARGIQASSRFSDLPRDNNCVSVEKTS
jgi:hypothetical protein